MEINIPKNNELCTEKAAPRPALPYAKPKADTIPSILKQTPQWLLWSAQWREEASRWDKVPQSAKPGRRGSSTDPSTWMPFDDAVQALSREDIDGFGFVLTTDDEFVAIDLDHCIDPETSEIDSYAESVISHFASYTEISPSGTGIHIIVKGSKPGNKCKNAQRGIEIYERSRYLTITGELFPGAEIDVHHRQREIDAFYAEVFPEEEPPKPQSVDTAQTPRDQEILDKMFKAKNSAAIQALWNGDHSGYGSRSEADLALCGHLAFYTGGDFERISVLFRQSGLMRDKWNREDYRGSTISKALSGRTEFYRPPRRNTAENLPPDNAASENAQGLDCSAKEPLPDGEVQQLAPDGKIPLSDTYNADRLVRRYGDRLRHCGKWAKWLVYRGGAWSIDHDTQVFEFAKTEVLAMVAEATQLKQKAALQAAAGASTIEPLTGEGAAKDADDDLAKAEAYQRHAQRSLNAGKLSAMVTLARSAPGIPIDHEDLDRHDYLIPAVNGVIDLETGELLPHSPAYLFSQKLPVAYDPDATCPVWEETLRVIFGGPIGEDSPDDSGNRSEARHQADERARRLVTFLQRAAGYSLTGSAAEHVLLILWGKGRNGKSLITNTLLEMFGDYGLKAPQSLFMETRNEQHPTERAGLFRRRFVVTSETKKDARLNIEFIKEATGGDSIAARRMREDFWQFKPTHTLWMATNNKPAITDDGLAIWERIRLIPFEVTFHDPAKLTTEQKNDLSILRQDKTLPQKLLAELPGILTWAVKGCQAWLQDGLPLPPEVRAATAEYKRSENNVEVFTTEGCWTKENPKPGADAITLNDSAKNLYERYVTWCDGNETSPVRNRTFGQRLRNLGFDPYKSMGQARYYGIEAKIEAQ